MCHALFQSDEFYIGNHNSSKASIAENGELGIAPLPDTTIAGKVEAPVKNENVGTLNQLEGILNFIYQVKAPHDGRNSQEKKKNPSPIMKLYREFLFYRHFFSLKRPLILCEGVTDPIYLRCALRQLANEYEGLVLKTDKGYDYKIGFLKFSDTLQHIFSISEGTPGLVSILNFYKKYMQKFKGSGKQFPVIMLFDNDNGSVEMKKIVNKLAHFDATKPYTHCYENLYVVHTPIGEDGAEAAIEDLFDENTLSIKAGGKTFNKAKKIDTKNEYGKQIFAKQVVEHQDEIDFNGFKEVLNSFKAIIEEYKHKKDLPPLAVEEPAASKTAK